MAITQMRLVKSLKHKVYALALGHVAVATVAQADYVDQACLGDCVIDCGDVCGGSSKGACIAQCKRDNDVCDARCVRAGNPSTATPGGSTASTGTINGLTYGEYCGPGHGDPFYQISPVDPVDTVCMMHDLCYDNSGYMSCGCDRQLLLSMPAALAASTNPAAHVAGAAAVSFFATSPCQCQICMPFGCFPFATGWGGIGPC